MSRPRPIDHLEAVARDYPGVWGLYDQFLAGRGRVVPDWPRWCHCPMAGAYVVVSGGGDNRVSHDRALDIARVAALAAWRPTQGIYRFDATLLAALWDTPLTGELPTEHLYRLPEWCVYIETPGRPGLHGYYAHLECDSHDGRTELRLLLDMDEGLQGLALHLGGTLEQAVDGMFAEAAIQGLRHLPPGATPAAARFAVPLVSVLLYLCASDAELRPTRGRGRLVPAMRTGKRGPSMPAAKALEVWEAGYSLGARLREAEQHEHQGGTVRPHVRRAHWHGYRVGPREASKLELRWLSPILVGAGPDRPTIREVE